MDKTVQSGQCALEVAGARQVLRLSLVCSCFHGCTLHLPPRHRNEGDSHGAALELIVDVWGRLQIWIVVET